MFRGDGLIVKEGLECLPVITLKYHFGLFPAGLSVIGLIGVDVEGLQVVKYPGIKGLPVILLLGQLATELRVLQTWGVKPGSH